MKNYKNFPNLTISLRTYYGLLGLAFLLAIISQYMLFAKGFYSLVYDESARSLMSDNLTLKTALEPFIWPPFYKIITGLFLKVYDDLLFAPRLMTMVFGLLTLGALILLSKTLFQNKIIDILTAFLSIYVPHRFLLSIAPMAEIYFYFFIILGSVFLIRWLREEKDWQVIGVSTCFFLASTVRYEGCFFSLVFLLFLTYRLIFSRQISLRLFSFNAIILIMFPGFWVINSWASYGSLSNLSITRMQAIAIGMKTSTLLRNLPLTQFLRDLVMAPILIGGFIALLVMGNRDRALRVWGSLLFSPLLILTFVSLITKSVAGAAWWRMGGTWTLLILPFAAYVLKRFSDRFTNSRAKQVLVISVLLCMLPFMAQNHYLYNRAHLRMQEDFQTGLYLRKVFSQDSQKVLIESESLPYLNVMVASNMPEQFILQTGNDPVKVAVYLGGRKNYWKENYEEIYEAYVKPKYALGSDLNYQLLKAQNIGYLLLQSSEYKDASREHNLREISRFGKWTLYKIL